jgi:ribosome-associated translation inhibitor RaiA
MEEKALKIADLKTSIEYFQKHTAFAVKLCLQMGKAKLIGEEKSHDLLKGIDLSVDRLISQLRKIESRKHDK